MEKNRVDKEFRARGLTVNEYAELKGSDPLAPTSFSLFDKDV